MGCGLGTGPYGPAAHFLPPHPAQRWDGPGGPPGPQPPTLLAATAAAPLKVPVDIGSYGWDQSEKYVKVYLTAKDCGAGLASEHCEVCGMEGRACFPEHPDNSLPFSSLFCRVWMLCLCSSAILSNH